MLNDNVDFIDDFMLRSAEEQNRLFKKGLSNCDGYKKKSGHQKGKAEDIYFAINGKVDYGYETPEANEYADRYHAQWVDMGGKPEIESNHRGKWDRGHYEG